MFEDIKKQDEAFVAGDPAKVEDMFGKVDPTPDLKSAVASGKLTPVAGATAAPQQMNAGMPGVKIGPPNPLTNLSQVDQWSTKRPRRGLKIALSVIAALLVTGATAAYVFLRTPAPSAPVDSNTNNAPVVEQPVEPVANQNTNAPTIPTNALIDTDGDGLTDLEEQAAGTDLNAADTDTDGLNDRDELRVHKTNPILADSDNDAINDRDEIFTWKTNPNNPDTDADTYQDGVEVQNGYDPNGPGKLPPTTEPVVPEPPLQTQ